MSFETQAIAAVKEGRLSTGDFITVLSGIDAEYVASGNTTPEIVFPPGEYVSLSKSFSVTALVNGACEAAKAGHVFDMGAAEALDGLERAARDAHLAGRLVVPYTSGTLFVFRMQGLPYGIYITADSAGGPSAFMSFVMATRDDELYIHVLNAQFLREPQTMKTALALNSFKDDGSHDLEQDSALAFSVLYFGLIALLMVSDDRLEFRRDVPAPALNKARAKSGKPPLPAVWRMPNAAAVAAYVTKLGIKGAASRTSKGGTHASPVQHERRGHLRRLPSGRITKVRSSLVGGLDKHLTRTRAFYEVKA